MLLHNLTDTIDVVVKPILYLILFDRLPLPLASFTHQHAILRLSTKIKLQHNYFPSMPGLWKVSIVYVLFLFTYSRHLFLYISFVYYSLKQTVLKKFRILFFLKTSMVCCIRQLFSNSLILHSSFCRFQTLFHQRHCTI